MYTVHPLKVGDIVEPEARVFYLGDCSKTIALGIFFFLVQGEASNVLVDTGVSKADAGRFKESMAQNPEDDALAQLARHGVAPESIETVVATHLHWDHLSPTVLAMPNAKVYVSPREIEMVTRPPHPHFAKFVYREVIDQLIRKKRFVETRDGDQIAPGIAVMSTPGHTFGGQSVIVETARGRAVITGDVCFTYRNLEEDTPGGFNCNLVECFSSLRKIRETAEIVLPGHDLEMLRRFPDGVG